MICNERCQVVCRSFIQAGRVSPAVWYLNSVMICCGHLHDLRGYLLDTTVIGRVNENCPNAVSAISAVRRCRVQTQVDLIEPPWEMGLYIPLEKSTNFSFAGDSRLIAHAQLQFCPKIAAQHADDLERSSAALSPRWSQGGGSEGASH